MRIAAYCRVSTNKEEQLESLKNQKEYFTEYAEKNGHTLVKLYADEGVSGKQINNRGQFLQMVADAREHLFDMIVTKDTSRLARNTLDYLTTIRELKTLGIELLFLTNNQTILGNSEFVLTLFAALAQEESANLSKRVKFGKRKSAQNGIVPMFIFGYNRIDNYKLEINEQQADIVRKIFDLYVNQGYGCAKITHYLIDNNIPTYKGGSNSWTTKTVRRILRNEIYKGTVINNKSEVIDFLTGKSVNKPSDEWYRKEYPEIAIIDKGLFDKAQDLFNKHQKIYKNKFPAGRFCDKHIFSGVIKCAQCGRSYTRKSYTYKNTRIFWVCPLNDQYSDRKCNNNFRINESDIIDRLEKYFEDILKDKNKYIENYIGDFYHILNKNNLYEKEISKITKNLTDIKMKKDKLIELYTNDIITMKELKEKIEMFDVEIKENESKLSDINKYIKKSKSISENIREVVYNIEKLSDTAQWSNFLIKKIIDRIEIDVNGSVKIFLAT